MSPRWSLFNHVFRKKLASLSWLFVALRSIPSQVAFAAPFYQFSQLNAVLQCRPYKSRRKNATGRIFRDPLRLTFSLANGIYLFRSFESRARCSDASLFLRKVRGSAADAGTVFSFCTPMPVNFREKVFRFVCVIAMRILRHWSSNSGSA